MIITRLRRCGLCCCLDTPAVLEIKPYPTIGRVLADKKDGADVTRGRWSAHSPSDHAATKQEKQCQVIGVLPVCRWHIAPCELQASKQRAAPELQISSDDSASDPKWLRHTLSHDCASRGRRVLPTRRRATQNLWTNDAPLREVCAHSEVSQPFGRAGPDCSFLAFFLLQGFVRAIISLVRPIREPRSRTGRRGPRGRPGL